MAIRWIIHDVMQTSKFTHMQKVQMGGARGLPGKAFETFKREMKPFENIPVTLLCLAQGVTNKKWVSYIKAHPKWQVQCHGWHHVRYDQMPAQAVHEELAAAKLALEDTFNTKITEFHCPFNKHNDMTYLIAAELGMEEVRGYRRSTHFKGCMRKCTRMDLHYWLHKDMQMARMMRHFHDPRPLYIIGAPRSGTTAYMRWLADRYGAIAIKEREHIWKNGFDRRRYYAQVLSDQGRDILIDKNCRNTMRIEQIKKECPGATFHHVIRDGRAVAYSWWLWAQKTHKKDQTLEGAARQWVDYVTYARKHLEGFREIRYEDLCENETDYFKSRNAKWRKNLTAQQKAVVEAIQSPLLEELGYK